MGNISGSKRIPDLTGKTFERLTVCEKLLNGFYNCICSCGRKVKTNGHKLITGHTKSCGCYRDVSHAPRHITWKETENGCWVCDSHKPSHWGYPQYMVQQKNYKMHRFIYEQMFGEIPEGMSVMHSCDNRMCINPEHLSLGTHQDNMHDMVNKKRHAHGERGGNSILKKSEVVYIRRNYRKIKGKDLAKMFGVSPQTICGIQKKRAWNHGNPKPA